MTVLNEPGKPLPLPKELFGTAVIIIDGKPWKFSKKVSGPPSQEPSGQKTTPEEKKD